MAKSRGGGSGSSRVLLGFIIGVVAAALVGYVYLRYGAHHTATTSHPSSMEKGPTPAPSRPRVEHPQAVVPPFGISEDVFEAGARVYRGECAHCHGTPGHPAALPSKGSPAARQLFSKASPQSPASRQPGEIYRKIAGGVTGMPAYRGVLSDTQMWQVSLLLANAGKELPKPVTGILTAP